MRRGADLLVVQTNNATFGFTDESVQQLAMSRLRAVEYGRAVVHISTVGVSALITPDGRTVSSTRLFTPAVLQAALPLRTRTTPATRLGDLPGWSAGRRRAAAVPPAARSAGGPGDRAGSWWWCRPTTSAPTWRRSSARLRAAVPAADVLVADDDSPDGTGKLADDLAGQDRQVHVLHRAAKCGLGAAYLDAFGWGLGRGYEVLVEMDADGSHAPEQLSRLLAAIDAGADVVLGSRWVPGGEVLNWPRSRELLSRGGNTYTRLALGIGLRDATGGYRAFRREALQQMDLSEVASQGYCFQVDLAWRAVRRGLRVVEVPITFTERRLGESKMSRAIVVEALWRVTRWGLRHRLDQLRALRS